jgi:hypothetical protein
VGPVAACHVRARTGRNCGHPRAARTASDPQGGGSYIVASEELGRLPRLMAAGPLSDYVMTVAVSIASGVAAITSAYPSMQPATLWIGVGVIVILLTGNLRAVRQAAAVSPYRRTPSPLLAALGIRG